MNLQKNYKKYSIRKANIHDEKIIFNWINDSEVRKFSFKKSKIIYSEHKKWFKDKLITKNYFIWIFTVNKNPCGLVRFEIKKNIAILNYLLNLESRGKNLAKLMLSLAVNKLCYKKRNIKIYAYVKPKNVSSIKSLLKANFKIIEKLSTKNTLIYNCKK